MICALYNHTPPPWTVLGVTGQKLCLGVGGNRGIAVVTTVN